MNNAASRLSLFLFLILISSISLLAGPNEDLLDWAGKYGATEEVRLQNVQAAVNSGGNVNAKGRDNFTALHLAARDNMPRLASFLIQNNADVNAQTSFKQTPIQFAAQSGATEIVRLLLQRGATANSRNQFGVSALKLANQNGHAEIVRLLRAAGATN